MIEKTCNRCGVSRPLDRFSKEKLARDGHRTICKECDVERHRLHREKNPAKYTEEVIAKNLKRNFGISIDDYNYMFADQNGCCAICNRHQSQFKKRFAVDHCHDTDKIRGLLCGNCNTALGLLKEDEFRLVSMIEYIQTHKMKPKTPKKK